MSRSSEYANSVSDLYAQQARNTGNAQAQSGQIWGNAIAQIGDFAGNALTNYAQQREEKKLNEGLEAELSKPNPNHGRIFSLVGVERGTAILKGLASLKVSPEDTYDRKAKALQGTMVGLDALTPDLRSKYYPIARQRMIDAQVIAPTDAPEAFDEAWWTTTINYGKDPAKGSLERVETVGDDGQAVTQFVTPKAGDTFKKPPTAEAKGAGLWVERNGEVVRVRETEVLPTDRRPGTEGSESVGSFESFVKTKYGEKPSPDQIISARRAYFPQQPPMPVIIQGDSGPMLVNRGSATATPVKDAEGNVVGPAPTAQERNVAQSYAKAKPILEAISGLSEKINTGQGVVAKAQGAAAQAAAKINLNDDVAEYEAMVSGFTPLIARALGHTGVLTQQDVDSVKVMFPRPGDSKSLRDRKVARITQLMGAIESGDTGTSAAPSAPAGGAPAGLSYQDYLRSRQK